MSDTVETTGEVSGAADSSNTVHATPATPDPEAIAKAARDAALREAQSAKDREIANVHKHYQSLLKGQRETAKSRLRELGDRDAEAFDRVLELEQKAQQFDAIATQAEQARQWEAYVGEIAKAYGLTASDPRLNGATSAEHLVSLAKNAMAEDARAERERIRTEEESKRRKAVDERVSSGSLETLGTGTPASGATRDLEADYKKEMLGARGKGATVGRGIRDKYRELGLNTDTIRIA